VNIFFDVQGTLLSEDSKPRPHAREVFLKLAEMGHDVYLWSTAGEGYAAYAAWVLGVEDVVSGCFGKSWVPEGITVDYAVDDNPSWVEDDGGFLVGAYDGNPWDQELLWVVEAVEA
jgi:hypothetical protein